MDHIGIADDIFVCFKDSVPRDAVFGSDLAQIVAGLDRVCVTRGRGIGLSDIQDKVARLIIGVDLGVFVPRACFASALGAAASMCRTPSSPPLN